MAVWCKTCSAPARRTEPGIPGKGIHEGDDPGDGHPVVLTDEDPVLRVQADAIEAEFGGVFTISVRFGWFRADLADPPPGVTPAHYEADDADGMRARLRQAAGR